MDDATTFCPRRCGQAIPRAAACAAPAGGQRPARGSSRPGPRRDAARVIPAAGCAASAEGDRPCRAEVQNSVPSPGPPKAGQMVCVAGSGSVVTRRPCASKSEADRVRDGEAGTEPLLLAPVPPPDRPGAGLGGLAHRPDPDPPRGSRQGRSRAEGGSARCRPGRMPAPRPGGPPPFRGRGRPRHSRVSGPSGHLSFRRQTL